MKLTYRTTGESSCEVDRPPSHFSRIKLSRFASILEATSDKNVKCNQRQMQAKKIYITGMINEYFHSPRFLQHRQQPQQQTLA